MRLRWCWTVVVMAAVDSGREGRARSEHMTMQFTDDGDVLVVTGDSGNPHALQTAGMRAVSCSCPDHQNRGSRCKHMIAWEEWLVDEVLFSDGSLMWSRD